MNRSFKASCSSAVNLDEVFKTDSSDIKKMLQQMNDTLERIEELVQMISSEKKEVTLPEQQNR